MTSLPARLRDETGSVTLELAIVAPACLLIISVLIFGGRLALAHQSVEAAAASAARQASISRIQGQANADGAAAASTSLAQEGRDCTTTTVSVDTTAFASPAGTPAIVTATVTCVVPLSDLAVPGLPGSTTVTATAISPLDTYRER